MYMLIPVSILSGFLISFLGGLPLGNLNITAVRLTLADGIRKACQFSIGVVLVEMIYLLLCMEGVTMAYHHSAVFMILRWFIVCLLFIMATFSFVSVFRKNKPGTKNPGQKKERKARIVSNGFVLGLLLSSVNILQIPYWTSWIAIAMMNSWVGKGYTIYIFTLAAGLGTFICLTLFILAGKRLSSWLTRRKKLLDFLFGVIFLAVALVQLYLILKP